MKDIVVLFFCCLAVLVDVEVSATPVQGCNFNEVVIILDVSETIKDSDLKQAKEFAQKIVSKVGVSDSPDGTRMGVAIFAETGKEKIYCNNYQTTESLERAVMKLSRDNLKIKLTNLRSGLENGFNILHKNGCGERNTPHQKVMILISDGRANTGVGKLKGIMFAAQKIRAAGVTIIPIAVGDAVKEDVLVEIAGGDKSRLVVGKNFDEFLYSDTIKVMSKQLCKPEEIRDCSCEENETLKNISKNFSDMKNMIETYEGSCHLEKVTATYKATEEQLERVQQRISNDKICIQEMKLSLNEKFDKNVFDNYKKCSLDNCYLEFVNGELKERITFLKKELTLWGPYCKDENNSLS